MMRIRQICVLYSILVPRSVGGEPKCPHKHDAGYIHSYPDGIHRPGPFLSSAPGRQWKRSVGPDESTPELTLNSVPACFRSSLLKSHEVLGYRIYDLL